jgi:peroxiredoxin
MAAHIDNMLEETMNFKLIIIIIMILIYMMGFSTLYGGEQNVPLSPEDICPLKIGQKIPAAKLKTVSGEAFDLNAAITKKSAIIIFYRGGWCPYCNMHLKGIGEIEQNLLDLGYQIIAISTDRPGKVKETQTKHKAKYTLLSDHKMTVSQAFGLAFKVPDAMVKKYKNDYKIDLEGDSGETHHLLPVPAVFIVGTDGAITFTYVNPNYKKRIDPKLLMAAAKAK